MKRAEPETCKFKRARRVRKSLYDALPLELVNIIVEYFLCFEGTLSRRALTHYAPIALCAAGENGVAIGFFNTGEVEVRNFQSGESFSMPGHTKGVTCLARLSDDVIVSGSYDETVRIWDLKSRSARFPLLMNYGGVHSVAKISHSNVATGSALGALHVFSFLTGEMLFLNEEAHSEDVMALASMENGKFASGSYDETIKVWSVETGECLLILKQENAVTALAPLANDLLAVSFYIGTCVWDLSKKSIVKKFASEGLSRTSHQFVQMSGLLFLCDHTSPSVALGLCADTYESKHRFVFTGRAEAAAVLPNQCLILANTGGFHIYQ
jgi:hypothetical protein